MSCYEEKLQLCELYQKLERLITAGETANAYGGTQDFDNPDGDVLSEFFEFIEEFFSEDRATWLEAFYQIFAWQFQSCHEGVRTYYENFYGTSEQQTIKKTASFLQDTQYVDLFLIYSMGQKDSPNAYIQIDKWINQNTELIWKFYVEILESHKQDFFSDIECA